MSDARPITFVTEFVCGSCWNSFSRDEGRVHDSEVAIDCPHCGHANPLDADEGADVTSKVAAAPAPLNAFDEDSQAFGPPPVAKNDFKVTAPGAVMAPTSVSAPTAAPPQRAHAATAAYQSGGTDQDDIDPFAPTMDAASLASAEGAGLDSDQFAPVDLELPDALPVQAVGPVSEETVALGSQAAIAAATLRAVGSAAASAGGGEAAVDADTIDGEGPVSAAATPISDEEIAAAMAGAGDAAVMVNRDPTPDFTPDPDSAAVLADTADDIDPVAAEPDEWKLKAPSGLTYNFHSLDAMMGWAATKSGAEMLVSADGENWFDFNVFAEHVRSGLSGGQAMAVLGGSSGTGNREELRFVGMESGAMQVRSAMDDIAAVDAREAAEMRLKLAQPNYSGDGAIALASGDEPSPAGGEELDLAAVDEEPAPELPPKPPPMVISAAATGKQPAVSPGAGRQTGRNPAVGGATRKSRAAQPAAKKDTKPAGGGGGGSSSMVIVAVVIALVAIGTIAAHFGGFIQIPGLP